MNFATQAFQRAQTFRYVDALNTRGRDHLPPRREPGLTSFHLEQVNQSHIDTDRDLALLALTKSQAGRNMNLAIEPFLRRLPGQSEQQGYQIARSSPVAQIAVPLHVQRMLQLGVNPRDYGNAEDTPWQRVVFQRQRQRGDDLNYG